jgi:LuxR family maltose regulon positive regulatory protein
LALIAAGRSNRRIADELFVVEDTVKTHIKSVYRKLGVHSRTQALARARELGLL